MQVQHRLTGADVADMDGTNSATGGQQGVAAFGLQNMITNSKAYQRNLKQSCVHVSIWHVSLSVAQNRQIVQRTGVF